MLSAQRWRGAIALLAAFGYAAIIELLQSVLPYRSGDPYDLAAGALGAAVGIGLAGSVARVAQALQRLRDGA